MYKKIMINGFLGRFKSVTFKFKLCYGLHKNNRAGKNSNNKIM